MRLLHLRLFVVAIAVVLPLGELARACSVPVFRYALERWTPDRYHAVVFHAGSLSADQRAALDVLQRAQAAGRANLDVHVADLDGQMTEGLRTLWDAQPGRTPWLVLLYPTSMAGDREIWAGPLTTKAATALVDSPARRAIAERIAVGQTAVWVLIEPPGRAGAAAGVLEEQLAAGPDVLALPPELMEASPHLTSRLRIEFSLLRIKRDDPEEAILLAMLLGTEPDLERDYRDVPIAIPIYGRGRTLLAMVGPGIVPENVLAGCRFLVGRCSCEIKAQNLGVDLLFDYPWRDALEVSLVDMVELPQPIAEPVGEPPSDMVAAPVAAPSPPVLLRNVLFTGGFIVVAAVVIGLLAFRRTGRTRP